MNTPTPGDPHGHAAEKPNKYIVLVILALSLAGLFYSFSKPAGKDVVSGTVSNVLSERDTVLDIGDKRKIIREQDLLVEIWVGKNERREVRVLNDYKPVAKGDKIFVRRSLFGDGEFNVVDISRTRVLVALSAVFIILVILTSGSKGLYSLIGLLFSFAVIFAFMVPQILKGAGPVGVGVGSAALILVPALYLSYGLNRKSIAAFLGIIIALFSVGAASNYLVGALQFTGLGEISMFLDMETSNSINLVGLIIAGVIIAAVGVLDDVAAIQSSVVFSLASANQNLRGLKLFREAMHVGRDHISAVVNTLVLAYTGASLPLILLFSLRRMPVDYFVSIEMVAEEIARTLISSSGLLLAVPLTTLIAVLMVNRNSKESQA